MTKLLIKAFIKNYNDINNESIRQKYGILGSFVGIILNIILFLFKLVIGIILNSVAITADSFNNLSDSASSIITLIGFKMANKPPDKEHPFGHGRIEYISALIISFIIMYLGFQFLTSSIKKIFNPEPVAFNISSILILFATIIAKIWLSIFNKYIGTKINSKSLIATSKDSINDVIVTSTTIASVFITKFFNIVVDGWFGSFVACILIYSGFSIAKDTVSSLLGESTDPKLAKKIKEKVLKYEGVLGVHDLLVHNYGPNKSMASIHVEVPHCVDIGISHEIIDKIEKDVFNELGVFLVIHMDPIDIDDERISKISDEVNKCIKQYSDEIEVHDFRIVDGINNINIIFDIVLPYEYTLKKQNSILNDIKTKISILDKKYTCVINVEKSYER